jgi:DNA (cytosine-5)-methyltransferase 1
VTSHASETHGGGAAPLGIVSPILVGCGGRAGQSEPRTADAPMGTQTAKADLCVASAFLVPRYGERPGQDPRTRSVEEPAPVIVPTGNEGSLAAVHLARDFGMSIGSTVEDPAPTVMPHGQGKTKLVAAFLAQHNSERNGAIKPGADVREPVSTITAAGGHQTVVAAHMLNMRGSDRRDSAIDEPARTFSAGGNHAAAVYAFLQKYYGAGEPSQAADEPMHTLTAKPRHGVVTVTIQGQPYAIVDIGMRMLTPRERFNAQGFRPDYVIDRGELEDGTIVPLTLEAQGAACGNSVCPDLAFALVAANYQPIKTRRRPGPDAADLPLMIAAE